MPTEARDEAMALYDTEGEAAFRLRLTTFDPPAEAAIESGDRQRLTRAFAVARSTGRSLSDWQAGHVAAVEARKLPAAGARAGAETLYANCDARVLTMMQDGALEEVEALMARGLDPALPAMKAVGVREIAAWLAGKADARRSGRYAATGHPQLRQTPADLVQEPVPGLGQGLTGEPRQALCGIRSRW